jgi:DNA-binding NarL/FixJ family response regulator
MTSFLIIDDHPLFRDALGNAIRLAHTDARILEAMSTFGSRGWAQIMSAKGCRLNRSMQHRR